ncbi:MAG TPA: 4-hydroxy-tetrahydrodipicolinate synthase [Steroidobacteraceae bacterium]
MFKGSIPALVTPMRDDGSIDLEAWDRLLDFHLGAGSDGVVVGGTTGESPTISTEELGTLIGRARTRLAGRIPVIAGSGGNSTAKSVVLSRAAVDAGADALLVVTPYYNRPTQEGLYLHFTAIADAAGAPVILYNVPSRTACDLLPETVARLSQHPRILGIKEATGEVARGEAVIRLSRPGFLLLSGDDPSAVALMRIGARGVISVTANVAARAMHEICAAALTGRFDEAAANDRRVVQLHEALFVEPNPIPAKWAVHRMGLIGRGIRLPLTPLTEARRGPLEAVIRDAGVRLA